MYLALPSTTDEKKESVTRTSVNDVQELLASKGNKFADKISHSIRISELDGLRGIAILLVVSFHYFNNQLVGTTDKLGHALEKTTQFGWLGVDLFFVLSGFLIGTILIANKRSTNYFKTFFTRRIVRIIPNYFLLLVCFTVIWQFGWFLNSHFLTGNNDIPLWSYYAMLHNVFMGIHKSLGNDALNVTWSIGVEEQFYLFFPFLVFFVNDRWIPWLLGGFIILASFFRARFQHWIPAYVLLPSRIDGLSMGFLLAWFNNRGLLLTHKRKLTRFLLVLSALVVLSCAFFYWKYDDLGPVKHTLFAIVFSSLVIFALIQKDSFYGAFLRSRVLVWIGMISYSLYLFHPLILGLAHEISNQFSGDVENHISSATDIITTIAAFIFSLLFSWIVYRCLEKPMVALGKRLKY